MDNTHNLSFQELWEELTRSQRRYVVARQHHATKAAAAHEIGLVPETVYAWPDHVEEAADRLMDKAKDAVQTGLKDAAVQAILRLPDLIESNDDAAALRAVQYAIDQLIGKPTQRSEVTQQSDIRVESDSLDSILGSLQSRAGRLDEEA
jgi:enoyl-CoA hydratase/carnithine racemase